MALFGMLAPQVAFGVGPMDSEPTLAPSPNVIQDIALHENGLLKGQVLDTQGAPVKGVRVAVVQQGKVITGTTTDTSGRFAIAGLRGGMYQVVTPQGAAAYRLWAPNTAPPAAQADALIVNGATVVRAGMGGGGVVGFLSNPWVLGGIVAAAIAVPLAMDDAS